MKSDGFYDGSDGFQSPGAWEREKAFIETLDEWEFERIYGDR